jgi:hypothetical protein
LNQINGRQKGENKEEVINKSIRDQPAKTKESMAGV